MCLKHCIAAWIESLLMMIKMDLVLLTEAYRNYETYYYNETSPVKWLHSFHDTFSK